MKRFTSLFILLIYSTFLNAQTKQEDIKLSIDTSSIGLEAVIISADVFFGSKANTINRTGSAYYMSSKELSKQSHTDISRILAKVPGVNSYDEDGFGLRPNISLRGVSAQRSAKITIMEDGVLIAPAPYSSPAAYYFPLAQRMSAVEVLKGSSQIEFGPFTTGGAINMVSSPITDKKYIGKARVGYGSFGNRVASLNFSQNLGQFAYMIEAYHQGSDGFKELPNSDLTTGFRKGDIVGKMRFSSKESAKLQQSFQVKFQYSNEDSDETYLGLSAADFKQNSRIRYASSANDNMTAEHFQLMGTHTLDLPHSFRITSVAYRNTFARNWYKLNDVVVDGTKTSISSVLRNPSANQRAYGIIKGENSGSNSLILKNNNRTYLSQGIQTKLDKHWSTSSLAHDFEMGLRYHYDEEDRFQWVNGYQMQNGNMILTDEGVPGTDANRISSANAFSSHVLYKITFNDKLIVAPGVRYESVQLARVDYGKSDVDRLGTNITEKENNVNKVIPGIGLNYKPNSTVAIFGGVHKGFSPPGIDEGSLPESSVNSELGIRMAQKTFYTELTAYNNNYSNLLGSDLAASGGTGTLTLFNAGAVRVQGIEALVNYDLALGKRKDILIPFEFSYTLTNSKFLSDFESADGIWGQVSFGDQVPYIPQNQFFASVGLEIDDFSAQLTGRYNGAFRTTAGSGEIIDGEGVEAYFVTDFASTYKINKKLQINLNINNLLNNNYLVATVPAGLRPGLPFSMMLGAQVAF